ncbi:MAG: hypothetical protein ACXVPQ_12335, partial [Bacteroidia bacterium]
MNFNCLEPAVNTTGEKPKRPFRIILRSLMWLFLLCLIALITCVCLVFIYEKEVKSAIVNELNKNLKAEVKIDPANI